MDKTLTRRSFIAAGAAVTLASRTRIARAEPGEASGDVSAAFPRTDPAKAMEIVRVSHFSADRVGALLKEDRSLALASWDWGFGDWETALGAASHMGNREIAEALMAHGARPNLFTFAMMDMVDAVRAACELRPGIQSTRGPHGITLLDHARNGKADRVEEYLTTLGGADDDTTNIELPETDVEIYAGTYRFSGCSDDPLVVRRAKRGGGIGIHRSSGSFRRLHRTGPHSFSPAGAPHVTVRFAVPDKQAIGLTIHRGKPLLHAKRNES